MQTYETLKHTTWACKYPVVFIAKCRKKGAVWAGSPGAGAIVSGTGTAKGVRDNRGAPDDRSGAYVDLDTAEVFGGASDGVHEGQGCDPHRSSVCRAKKELCGAAVLGTRLLGVDGGQGRSRGAAVHPRPRKRRSAAGSTDADAALSGYYCWRFEALH
jgi:hypothetical protein